MKPIIRIASAWLVLGFGLSVFGASKTSTMQLRDPTAMNVPSYTPLNLDARDALDRFRLTSGLGVRVLREQTAVLTATRLTFRPGKGPWMFGGEGEFSLFNPGSVLGALFGGWYETRVGGAPRLSLILGGSVGVGSVSSVAELTENVPMAIFEAAIVQEIDDLVSMQGQFRPGIVGGYFSFSMNLSVSFRFQ